MPRAEKGLARPLVTKFGQVSTNRHGRTGHDGNDCAKTIHAASPQNEPHPSSIAPFAQEEDSATPRSWSLRTSGIQAAAPHRR
jgi:hypothetical protein